jgi:uncharacterized protein (TIGR02001 family)
MNKHFNKTLLTPAVAGVLLAGGLATTTTVSAEVSANVGVVSQYYFRGLQLTDSAAVQGGVDYEHESGFYVGTWASNLEGGDPSYELDVYLGFSGEAGGIGYDVGYNLYAYPDSTENINYGELYGSISFGMFEAGLAYTVHSDVSDDVFAEGDLYYYASVGLPLPNDFALGLTVGYYDFDVDGSAAIGGLDASYAHASASLSKDLGSMGEASFNLEYADISDSHWLGTDNSDDLKVWLGWSMSF